MKKKYKTTKHPNKVHKLQKIYKKNQHLKLISNKKKGRFAYLKWRILNKTRMLTN
jgi:hypothetical protein